MNWISTIIGSVIGLRGTVPRGARSASVALGVILVIMCVTISVRASWNEQLSELLVGFIAMNLLFASILMKVGSNDRNESSADNRNRIDSSNRVDVDDHRSKEQ